jgi:hypothetical protein
MNLQYKMWSKSDQQYWWRHKNSFNCMSVQLPLKLDNLQSKWAGGKSVLNFFSTTVEAIFFTLTNMHSYTWDTNRNTDMPSSKVTLPLFSFECNCNMVTNFNKIPNFRFHEYLSRYLGFICRWIYNRPNLISAFLKLCHKYIEKTKLNTRNT